MSTDNRKRAIVIGGSMAGLMAARVLSSRFDEVTVVERDRFPEDVKNRAGAPQGQHVHVLLIQGRRILERLFPGFEEELCRGGAVVFDSGADFKWLTPGGWAPRFPCNLPLFAASRALIEWVVRRRVMAQPNVRVIQGVDVSGVTCAPGGGVSGINLRYRSDGHLEHIGGAMVADGSGRGSKMPEWLEAVGYGRPAETKVDGHLAYASRTFRRTAGADWRAAYSQAAPPENNRTGLVFPIEGDRWLVTLAGGGGDHPPTDEEGFRAFARSLPNPEIGAIVESAEALTPIVANRGTHNRMRHYERLRLPDGLAVLGDAFCAFNPVYGQGMSTAALGAELLGHCLDRRALAGFHINLARRLKTAWMFATSEDMRYPGAEGGQAGWRLRMMHAYIDRVIAASTGDRNVRLKLLQVTHLLEEPGILFTPPVAWKAFAARPRTLARGQAKQPASFDKIEARTGCAG
ncbi:MAG: hypothetical protein SFV51_01895 [Bryobacteraceae bacterium]|nr:hypothetical protein [Bryobacteraceae bacterium]